MMMMMMNFFSNSTIVAIAAVVLQVMSVVPVVQAQTQESCFDLSKKECKKSTECTFQTDCLGLFGRDTCVRTIGFKSVVRQGEGNAAIADFCTVGGGIQNINDGGWYNVIGGGKKNKSFSNTATISGGSENLIQPETDNREFEQNSGSTINGGQFNNIDNGSSFCVITGGGGPLFDIGGGNKIEGTLVFEPLKIIAARESTISGGKRNLSKGEGSVVTGGTANSAVSDKGSVVTGGRSNGVGGLDSVIIGGKDNQVLGDYSIAFGNNAFAAKDSSMVMNLIEPKGVLVETTEDGQFLVNAETLRFQIGNGENIKGDVSSTKITGENIDRLIEALAS